MQSTLASGLCWFFLRTFCDMGELRKRKSYVWVVIHRATVHHCHCTWLLLATHLVLWIRHAPVWWKCVFCSAFWEGPEASVGFMSDTSLNFMNEQGQQSMLVSKLYLWGHERSPAVPSEILILQSSLPPRHSDVENHLSRWLGHTPDFNTMQQ